MKTNQEKTSIVDVLNEASSSSVDLTWTQQTYHEMADVPVVQVDLMSQFLNQLEQLEDLQARTAFVMREVRYLMKA